MKGLVLYGKNRKQKPVLNPRRYRVCLKSSYVKELQGWPMFRGRIYGSKRIAFLFFFFLIAE